MNIQSTSNQQDSLEDSSYKIVSTSNQQDSLDNSYENCSGMNEKSMVAYIHPLLNSLMTILT